MTTIKLKFRPSTSKGKAGRLFYQVIYRRAVRQLKTQYSLSPEDWAKLSLSLHANFSTPPDARLRLVSDQIRREMKQMRSIAQEMESTCMGCSIDELVDAFSRITPGQSVFAFMQSVIDEKNRKGCVRTGETYQTTLNRFKQFRQQEDLSFEAFTAQTVELFEAYLLASGLRRNTSSFYLRILRTVYNLAVDREIAERKNLFRHVYTGADKTTKRAISQKYIRKIKQLDCSSDASLDFARDLFLFSFYTRGMSFVDIAYLRKTDLKYGVLTYWRKKTGQRLDILWEPEMQELVEKHPNAQGTFLLPIITVENGTERRQYRNALHLINRKLKRIGEEIGLPVPLSMYAARHSWASIAKEQNIPLSVISEGMGHDSETTTQIYLASLSTSVVDRANRKILRAI